MEVDNDRCCEFERVVMQWAEEHPEPRYPSWNEWQTANFPDGDGTIPPCRFVGKKEMERINGTKCEHISCWRCANNPIPADIAEKLGLKPIGGEENEKSRRDQEGAGILYEAGMFRVSI